MAQGERLSPKGQSLRQKAKEALSIAVAAALGGGAAGVLNAGLDRNWKDLKTTEEKLDHFRTGPTGFDTDESFHAAAAERTVGEEVYSRAEYVQHIFSNTEPVKMPAGIRDKLAMVAPGIPAQESRYNNNIPTSRSGARFIWQLTQPAIDTLNGILKAKVKLEDTNSLKVATPLAFAYFDQVIYPKVEVPARRVLAQFGLSENQEAEEQFFVYCMINAYNAGPTRIAEMLDTFASKYGPRHVHHAYEYTPLSLFQSFAEVALRPPGGMNAGYKYESGEYVFRVLAGAESLSADSMLKYEKTLPEAVSTGTKRTFYMVLQEALIPAVAGAAGGVVGQVAMNIADDPSPRGAVDGLVSRRTAILAGAGAVAGVAAHNLYKGQISMPSLPDMSDWGFWRTAEKSEGATTRFEDGTMYRPRAAREKFRALGGALKLLPGSVTAPDLKPYLKNLTTSGVVEEVKKMTRITHADVEKQTAAYRALGFTVDAVGSGWRCRGVGMGASQSGANDARYLRLTGAGGAVLKKITAEFQVALKKAGLADGWRIRPIVNSLLRSDGSDGTNKGVVGASRNSPHTVGIGIDFSFSRFDIINVKTGEFFMTNAAEGDHAADAALARKLRDILAAVLVKMHGKDFVLTAEKDHYHVSVVVPEKSRR